MSPHDENPPSVAAGGPSTSKVPSSIVQQKPAKSPHGLKPMLRARYPHETPRSAYPSASTPIPSNCMQYLGPTPGGPGVLAAPTPAQPNIGAPLGVQNHPTKAGALGGDGAGDTAGLHPSESTGERGTSKRKASLGDRLAEFRDRLMKRKKSDCKGPGPKKEDEQ
ncbi:uncharacterized protein PAC_07419 [Phialocephala subalpina]|uniref:Uncharacterized protein n=1 Tax=Phialocephala subalpina TaxID=576137 RepID=A0A1L7WXN0_9HELO|nr:uncharacterized protein PAC_07419 [Phialocephala subalpina]